MTSLYAGRNNLLQNPGFENGLEHWTSDNVTLLDTIAVEGTQMARLGGSFATLSQTVPLGLRRLPLLLSFIVLTQSIQNESGNLIAEVQWLNAGGNVIGTGLRLLVNKDQITQFWATLFGVTDAPPIAASRVRLLLSKSGSAVSEVLVDQLMLTEVLSPNLVKNSGFETGLEDWKTDNFFTTFGPSFTNSAAATVFNSSGTLYQDVMLEPGKLCASYMLSFAAKGFQFGGGTLTVRLVWLNALGNPIGEPGIDTFIEISTLENQGNFLSYLLFATAPLQAVCARISFSIQGDRDILLYLDQVLLVRTASENLVRNAGFEDDLHDWEYFLVKISTLSVTSYLGNQSAELEEPGAYLYQTVPLPLYTPGNSYLFSAALFDYQAIGSVSGYFIAEVRWLDALGRDLGLGGSMYIPLRPPVRVRQAVYAIVTESAPPNAVEARVQFTKAKGNMFIDNVVLAKLK